MSSKQPPQVSLTPTAQKLMTKTYRRTFGRHASRGSGPFRLVDAGSELTSETLDLAREVAGVMLRAAATLGEDLIEMASQLEPVVSSQARRAAPRRETAESESESGPVALDLSDAGAGGSSSKNFVVRNDSLDTIDALGLRCSGLFGSRSARIAGSHVKLSPVTVSVSPRSTVNVTCKVSVPGNAKRGRYVGLIEAPDRDGVQLLVTLNVI